MIGDDCEKGLLSTFTNPWGWYLVVHCCIVFYNEWDKFYTSSHQKSSLRKGVLKNSAKFTVKHMCWILFLGAQLEMGEEGGLPCTFSKTGKTCANFGKKCPNYDHLWVKFLI